MTKRKRKPFVLRYLESVALGVGTAALYLLLGLLGAEMPPDEEEPSR